jgi:hypothetical protein
MLGSIGFLPSIETETERLMKIYICSTFFAVRLVSVYAAAAHWTVSG